MQTRCTISTDLRRSANLQNNCCNIKFRNTTDSSKGVPNNIIKSKSGQAEFIKSKSNSNPSWIRKSAGFKSKSTSRIKGSVRTSPESSPKLHKRLCGVIAGRALCRLALNQGSQTHGLRAARGPRGSLVRPAMLFGNFQITWTYVAKCFEKRCREIIESKLNDTVAIRKPERASAQSFALWQQATIEFTCHDHSPRTLVITCNCSHVNIGRTSTPRSLYHCLFTPHTYIVVLHAHPVRGESHNQRNANGEVATSIPSAVFHGRSATDHISLSRNILRNFGSMPKTSLHALSTSREHTTGFLVKSFWEWCVCTVLPTACYGMAIKSLYSCTEVCVRVRRVKSRQFTVGIGLRQGCVLSLLVFIVYISGSPPFHWREPNPDLQFYWRASLKCFNIIQFTRLIL